MIPINKTLLAIDAGNIESGYVFIDAETYKPISYGKIENAKLEQLMLSTHYDYLALEMVASYGMRVGQSVFNTCFHIGRFSLVKPNVPYDLVFRQNVKMHLLGKVAVGDAQIRDVMVHRFLTQAEMERWGDYGKGVKADKGMFYGFNNDIYQAYSVGITWLDITDKGNKAYEY